MPEIKCCRYCNIVLRNGGSVCATCYAKLKLVRKLLGMVKSGTYKIVPTLLTKSQMRTRELYHMVAWD